MNETAAVLIGAFRRIKEHGKTMPTDEAVDLVSSEITAGFSARNAGKTKAIPYSELIQGRFMGEPAPDTMAFKIGRLAAAIISKAKS